MDGKCHFIVFMLFVRYAISQKCDCKLLDILKNIVQREVMEREMLLSRVEMLESKQGSGTNNGADSSGYSSEANILERLSVIETMIEHINNKLKETSTERQNGERLYSALKNAWRIHKKGLLVTNEGIQTRINDNNNRFNQLTREAEKSIEVVEFKVESLINQTNDKVAKQLKKVEDRFEVIHFGLNKTFQEYTTKMNKDFRIFINQTDRALNGIRAEITSNECASDPCKNGATCVDGVLSYTCICMTGYGGSHCQIDVDECDSNPCLNGATCVTGINNYACKCAAGYEGTNCQIDINECASSPCMNGATCIDGINKYACKCALGYAGTNCQTGQDCTAIRKTGVNQSGVYTVSLWKTKHEIQVYCDMSTDNGGWTVFQNRFDGSVDFYQNFASYENGFGHLSGEFWLGLKYVQEMSSLSQTELRLDLSAADGSTAHEVFQNFRLTEGPGYKLNIDPGTGTAGDEQGLSYNKGYPFTTFDHDADRSSDNCAVLDHGGWWYYRCAYANLNGEYITPGTVSSVRSERGMTYRDFKGYQSLQTSKMMFRRNIA